jgi:hypothetical protein
MNALARRMTFGLSAILAFCLTALPASSTEFISIDGAWWKSASDLQKLTMIQGLSVGLHEGWDLALNTAYYSAPSEGLRKLRSGQHLDYSKTVGAYKDLIDAVETDPAAEKLSIHTVMLCLADSVSDRDGCIRSWEKTETP